MTSILITGAAGNLGSRLARHLADSSSHELKLMTHRTPLPEDLKRHAAVTEYRCDLAAPASLEAACRVSDVIVHFAGILFAPGPETFLPVTNTQYTMNLVDAAVRCGVKRFILISFPHVQGPTTPESPCNDREEGEPISAHARTRRDAERYVLKAGRETGMKAISLRLGMVYGREILMVWFARKLAEKRLLGVWREPTCYHMISLDDFHAATQAAIESPTAAGIYPLGDDAPTTLQEFLDVACDTWRLPRPWRVPLWSVYAVAWTCEKIAALFDTRAPFTVDFIRIGRVPFCCDTSRMKAELLPRLKYPTLQEGKITL
jgi:nucleoside-diphosphate-sugar epimerase